MLKTIQRFRCTEWNEIRTQALHSVIPLKKISRKCYTRYFLDFQFLDTRHCKMGYGIFTRRTLRHALNSPVPVTVEQVLLRANTSYVILVDVIQTLTCFDDWNSLREAGSVTRTALVNGHHGLYGHQPMKMPEFQFWNESRGEAHAIAQDLWIS
jgi:hypothetical protein